MPKSRGRKPKQRRQGAQRSPRHPRPSARAWGELEPWARAMVMADEAEARGDVLGSLEIMEAFATGPDGQLFWRPWRVKHLVQIDLLGPLLPGWVTSRWICNQAMQCLHDENRSRRHRAFDLAVELRRGVPLPGRNEADAFGRVADRDWVYRQLFLYELGGLDHFVRRGASSVLLSQADSVHEWARTPMGGYRLVGSTSATVTWLDLATDEERTVPNIGSGCLIAPGEHVIGRLVPIDIGAIFEDAPLLVSEDVARAVAGRPADWLQLLRESSPTEDELSCREHRHPSLISDVPTIVWELAILRGTEPVEEVDDFGPSVARRVLDVAAEELAAPSCRPSEGEVDSWSCIGAALLEPYVVPELVRVAGPEDRQTLEELGRLLAEPAASVCRRAARELFDAA